MTEILLPTSVRRRRPLPDELLPPDRIVDAFVEHHSNTPDWRYGMAMSLTKKGSHSSPGELLRDRQFDSLVVQQIVPFLDAHPNSIGRNYDGQFDQTAANRCPGLYWAGVTHAEMKYPRWAVEAFITGRASDVEIALKLNVDPNSIWWYRQAFYDVTGFLDNETWMSINVLHPARSAGRGTRDYLWKVFGFVFGARGVEQMLKFWEAHEQDMAQTVRIITDRKLLEDTLHVIATSEPTKYDRAEVVNQFLQISQEADAREGAKASNMAEEQLIKCLKTLGDRMSKAQTVGQVGKAEDAARFKSVREAKGRVGVVDKVAY